jgi:hypothetical protein
VALCQLAKDVLNYKPKPVQIAQAVQPLHSVQVVNRSRN